MPRTRDTEKELARRGTILACLLLGCGPVTATRVIDSADAALVRTRGADGDKLAPYETTLADLYLAKAREKQAYAQYGDAEILAAESRRFADAAILKAGQRRTSESTPAPGISSMVPKQ